MEKYTIVILILLLQVIFDALGDGFRVRGWQKPHHTMETIREGIWIGLFAGAGLAAANLLTDKWYYFDFQWYYIFMYVLGRIWMFDLMYNITANNKLFYVSETSWDGVIIHWIAGTHRTKNRWPVQNVAFIIKLMAIGWWFAWLLTNRDSL